MDFPTRMIQTLLSYSSILSFDRSRSEDQITGYFAWSEMVDVRLARTETYIVACPLLGVKASSVDIFAELMITSAGVAHHTDLLSNH